MKISVLKLSSIHVSSFRCPKWLLTWPTITSKVSSTAEEQELVSRKNSRAGILITLWIILQIKYKIPGVNFKYTNYRNLDLSFWSHLPTLNRNELNAVWAARSIPLRSGEHIIVSQLDLNATSKESLFDQVKWHFFVPKNGKIWVHSESNDKAISPSSLCFIYPIRMNNAQQTFLDRIYLNLPRHLHMYLVKFYSR